MMLFKNKKLTFIILVTLLYGNQAFGDTMSSSLYKIQSDTVNFGGTRSNSSTYTIEDTAGEVATGESESSSFKVKAGFQQMQGYYFSVTAPTNVTMSPALGGITGGTANGGTSVIVTTDNVAGYTVTLTASSSVGMIGIANGGNIPAYVPTGTTTPEYDFATPANKAYFGYTVEASTTADLATAFKDTGVICGAGSNDTIDKCWLNASTTAVTILNRSSATSASGSTSTIKFRVFIDQNPIPVIPQDTYVATTTITVLPQ